MDLITPQQRVYWRKSVRLTVGLLIVWFVLTFVTGYFATELNQLTVFGFPLGFYVGAQGALIGYVIIVAIYAVYMNRLDRRFGVEEHD